MLLSLWQYCVKPAGSAVPHLSGDAAKLGFPKLWASLEVTFLYEHHLLELRHIAFEGKSHLRKSIFLCLWAASGYRGSCCDANAMKS